MNDLINKILAAIAIPADKLAHCFWGLVFFAALHFIVPVVLAFGAVAAVMITKEAYDYLHQDKHTPDAWDAVAGIAGAGLGWLCALPALILLKF